MTATRRLFFALWPDSRQRERVRKLMKTFDDIIPGRLVPEANWHMTLVFIGQCPASQVPTLLARAADTAVEPIRLDFDRIEYWPRPRIACLAPMTVPDELGNLHGALNSVIAALGLKVEQRAYRPHMTVARKARLFTTQRLAQPLTLEFDGFELVESVPGRGGVRYIPLKQ